MIELIDDNDDYILLRSRIKELEQENQKKLYTSNGNKFTKYELLDDYESILQENQQLKKLNDEMDELATLQLRYANKMKSVLDEIRERIEFFMEDGRGSLLELLKILDKVKQ